MSTLSGLDGTWVPWASQIEDSLGTPDPMNPGQWLPKYATSDFAIHANPATPVSYEVEAQGPHCHPGDGIDDTWCIARAIYKAQTNGGTVVFSPGIWDMNPGFGPFVAMPEGTYQGPSAPNQPQDCEHIDDLGPAGLISPWYCLVSYTSQIGTCADPANCPPEATGFIDNGIGIKVPPNVNLLGTTDISTNPPNRTRIRRGAQFKPRSDHYLFTLTNNNQVRNIVFTEEDSVSASLHQGGALAIGCPRKFLAGTNWCATEPLENIVIAENTFEWMDTAITAPTRPINQLFVTDNIFGAFRNALTLWGSPDYAAEKKDRFTIKDSVIRGNTFYPGGHVKVEEPNGHDGTIASHVYSGERLMFVENSAQGDDQRYNINSMAPGFRAAFFFANFGTNDMMLLANNDGHCTGDKAGDGEFISFDDNHRQLAFYQKDGTGTLHAEAVPIKNYGSAAPGKHYVDLSGDLTSKPFGTDTPALDINADPDAARTFFVGSYLAITNGDGIGQVRKIRHIEKAGNSERVYFEPWLDFLPALNGPNQSYARIGTMAFHMYTVANHSDQSRDPSKPRHCASNPMDLQCPSNANNLYKAGTIYAANLAHSTIEGNSLTEAGGIVAHQSVRAGSHHYFTEIIQNQIDKEQVYDSYSSWGGIHLAYERDMFPSPVTNLAHSGVGINIANNIIDSSSSFRGGAISVAYGGALGQGKTGSLSTIIHHNDIRGLTLAPIPSEVKCSFATLGGEEPKFWHAHLNSCVDLSPFYWDAPMAQRDNFVHGAVVHANACSNEAVAPMDYD
ncbi:MAG TPA: hypothetical protein PK156_48925, partial [Polyangium sp.]|nr:hypothetical protein [Polyangium sp.]